MAPSASALPPCVLHEDEHLLVVNKPPGWNTHSPSPYAGEGIYEWLKHREPRWANLAIIHRLDKETSGVMVFGKTRLANQSLTTQFEQRQVDKRYHLLTEHEPAGLEFLVESRITRAGNKYIIAPTSGVGDEAATHFNLISKMGDDQFWVEARPLTGRTHQIRVHATARGFPIDGDVLYGAEPGSRVYLHAISISLRHPTDDRPVTYSAPANFGENPRWLLRSACITPQQTNAFRVIHGAADACPGWYEDRLGDYLLSQSEGAADDPVSEDRPSHEVKMEVPQSGEAPSAGDNASASLELPFCKGRYHKQLSRHIRMQVGEGTSPQLISGEPAPDRFTVLENGLTFELSFNEGYSTGLFLDQRDNRRRLLVNHVGAKFPLFAGGMAGRQVLNTFAYTCAFSVAAAKAGASVTSLDLSRKYLDWGRRNFELNGLDPAQHDFIYGDCFDWLKRLVKKGRQFDLVLLDPPTFSQSKQSGVWRAEKDYGKLVAAALPLLSAGGVLFASTNAASMEPERFLEMIEEAVQSAGRRILQQHYVPQSPDFPITREEPAYLKTVWLRVS